MTLKRSMEMSSDVLQAGVIETMATESKLLAILPFKQIEGAGYSYIVEEGLSEVEFRAINKSYTASSPELAKYVADLAILGGEAVVDSFRYELEGAHLGELMGIETALKAKSIAHTFENTVLKGDKESDPNAFNGIMSRVLPDNTISAGIDLIDDIAVLVDAVQGGANAIILNKNTRRKLTRAAREELTQFTDEFGNQIEMYDGITLIDLENNMLKDGEVLAVRFSDGDGVCGIQSTTGITVTNLGQLDYRPQYKTRIEWFVGLAVFNPYAIAVRTAE